MRLPAELLDAARMEHRLRARVVGIFIREVAVLDNAVSGIVAAVPRSAVRRFPLRLLYPVLRRRLEAAMRQVGATSPRWSATVAAPKDRA